MKRFAILSVIFILAVSVQGCTQQETEEAGINVYYINEAGDGLVFENIASETVYSDELVETLIERISSDGSTQGSTSVLQNGISVESYDYNRSDEELDIDLSGDYGSLSSSGKLLLTAGVTLTFEQIEDVSDVYLTIQGEALLDSNGNDLGALNEEDFVIHSGNEINIYTSTSMVLYFLDSTGEELVPETRTVYYNSNVPLEQVVLEELIKGPQEYSNQAALASTTDFLSVTTQEDICYVNFDENVIQTLTSYDCELALQSIVKSINSVCGISNVQFSINGDTSAKFADGTSVDHIYSAY